MSTRPNASCALAIRVSHCALSEIRQVMAVASPPLALIAATTSSHGSRLRPEITTLAPASAKISAIARPMPRDEPVTTATFPDRSKRLIHFPLSFRDRPGREARNPWTQASEIWVPGSPLARRPGMTREDGLPFLPHQRIAQDGDAG